MPCRSVCPQVYTSALEGPRGCPSMLAGMISKWSAQSPTNEILLQLPPDNYQGSGQLLSLSGVSPLLNHGLRLRNGKLSSVGHSFRKLSKDKYSIMLQGKNRVSDSIDFVNGIIADVSNAFNYISTIDEYTQWVTRTNMRSGKVIPIFRGHSDASYPLLTTLDRLCKNYEARRTVDFANPITFLQGEKALEGKVKQDWLKEILAEFITLSKEQYTHFSPLEWLVYARHSGLPVPVIDFTLNPLIALYFALRFSPPSPLADEDCIVYALFMQPEIEPRVLMQLPEAPNNGYEAGSTVESIGFDNTISSNPDSIIDQLVNLKTGAIRSPRSTPSSWLQQSVLLNISLGEEGSNFYTKGFALSHCVIKAEDRLHLIRELMMLGIDETSIFESPEALALSITQRHFLRSIGRSQRW